MGVGGTLRAIPPTLTHASAYPDYGFGATPPHMPLGMLASERGSHACSASLRLAALVAPLATLGRMAAMSMLGTRVTREIHDHFPVLLE